MNHSCTDEFAASLLWTELAMMRDGVVRQPCRFVDRKLTGKTVIIIRQVTAWKSKSGTVVKHQRKAVVLKTTSNIKLRRF